MNYEEVIKARRSIRKFTRETVSDELIEKLLHYGMAGPSAHNYQPWEFLVIKSKAVVDKLTSATKYCHYDAPSAIVVCGNKDRFLPKEVEDYWMQDCAGAVVNILNGVTYLGLGAVWCGLYPNILGANEVKSILNLNDNLIPMALIFIGHPDEIKEARDQYDPKKVQYF